MPRTKFATAQEAERERERERQREARRLRRQRGRATQAATKAAQAATQAEQQEVDAQAEYDTTVTIQEFEDAEITEVTGDKETSARPSASEAVQLLDALHALEDATVLGQST